MSSKNGVLIATAAAAIFAVLPATATADTTATPAPATKAMNNCCGGKPTTATACKKTASGTAKNSCAADCKKTN